MYHILINIYIYIMSTTIDDWTSQVSTFVKNKDKADYMITSNIAVKPNCKKRFESQYTCNNNKTIKTVLVDDAIGKNAKFDCSDIIKSCKGFKLTLGDDGNLVLTDSTGSKKWESGTNKTGEPSDIYKASKSKYGRNYLMDGEQLSMNEFIGSPSGNCYLIMTKTPGGNGLQIQYSQLNCDKNNYGNDMNTNGLFSLAKTAYSELQNVVKKVTPQMDNLDRVERGQDYLGHKRRVRFKEDVRDYNNVNRSIKNIKIDQLNAMNEDTGLFLTRYRYRRILWLTLMIVIIIGGIKIAKQSSS